MPSPMKSCDGVELVLDVLRYVLSMKFGMSCHI